MRLWFGFVLPIYPLSKYRFLYTKKNHAVFGEPFLECEINDILVRKVKNKII